VLWWSLPVDPPDRAEKAADRRHPRPPHSSAYTRRQWQEGLDRRRKDIADLVDVAGDLAAVDDQVAQVDRRVTELLAMASSR